MTFHGFSHSIVLHKLCSWTARLSLICPSFPASFLSPYSAVSSLTLTLNTERSIVAHAHLGEQCYSPHCLLSSLQNSFQLTSKNLKIKGIKVGNHTLLFLWVKVQKKLNYALILYSAQSTICNAKKESMFTGLLQPQLSFLEWECFFQGLRS